MTTLDHDAAAATSRRLRSQEFAEDAVTCFRATGECCFDVAAIEDRLDAAPYPIVLPAGATYDP